MRVIVDSDQIIRDWFLSGPAFRELLRESERGHIELIVPQVVLDEVTNKYREALQDAQRDLKKAVREFERLDASLEFESLDDTHIDQKSSNYKTRLREAMSRNRVKVAPYPVVGHEVIARRALDRRKPFDMNGQKGYRDTLIWFSVLDAAADDKVIFISANWTDFAQSKDVTDRLADDLLQDLGEAGHDRDHVTLYSSVGAFVKSWIAPAVQIRQQLQDRLDSDKYFRIELRARLESEIVNQLDLTADKSLTAASELVEAEPEAVLAFNVLKIQDARKFGESDYLVTICVEADVEIVVTERKDTGSWRGAPRIETRSTTETINFEFDATYQNEVFTDIQLTYPTSASELPFTGP